MRELAHDLGLQVETLRESPPGMGERGDVRSESPQAVCEGAQNLYSVVRGRLQGRRGDEEAGTGRRQASTVPGEARRGPRPAGETSPGREHRASTRPQRRGASFHRSCARESRSRARLPRSSPSRERASRKSQSCVSRATRFRSDRYLPDPPYSKKVREQSANERRRKP